MKISKVKKSKKKRNSLFECRLTSSIFLGYAWSGNSINQVIYRNSGLLTNGNVQIATYYRDRNHIRVIKNNVHKEYLELFDISGDYNLDDAHNNISIGYDRDGFYHIAYGHHASKLKYRLSRASGSISAWTSEIEMTGANEHCVTYPTFINPSKGSSLLFLYRDGFHNKGAAYLKKYDELSRKWIDNETPILSGVNQKPFSCNPYWNTPVVDRNGVLHLTFVWRFATGSSSDVNNINICYAKSKDEGQTWTNSNGDLYSLPITPNNAEVILEVPAGSNLMNQCSMAVDSNCNPHIVFYSNDKKNIPQYKYLWRNGGVWIENVLSKRLDKFNLSGNGSLKLPISRPEIVIDRFDRKYIIYRGDFERSKFRVMKVLNGKVIFDRKLFNFNIGNSEPIIDKTRWFSDGVLSLLVQCTNQPNEDKNVKNAYSPIRIIDVLLA